MGRYAIGYVVTVFQSGVKTKFKYAGSGEWVFISGINSPSSYEQLMQIVGK